MEGERPGKSIRECREKALEEGERDAGGVYVRKLEIALELLEGDVLFGGRCRQYGKQGDEKLGLSQHGVFYDPRLPYGRDAPEEVCPASYLAGISHRRGKSHIY